MAGIDRWLHYTVTTIDRFHCCLVTLSCLLLQADQQGTVSYHAIKLISPEVKHAIVKPIYNGGPCTRGTK